MQISVTFRNMKPSEALKKYVAEKTERLKKYFSRPADVHVVLAKHKYRSRAEIKVSHSGQVMKGEENTEDMYSSIDLALDKVERQVIKNKDKRQARRSTPSVSEITVRHGIVEHEPKDEQRSKIVDTEEFSAKPMSVDEAVMQMELMNNDFLVFLNATSQDVNVIYKRRDGNIGLIEAKTPTN
ncbi:MAG: ribosome-associated translation inhibitor RaiA [Deltaproteobacteria bacterium]|nr:ribosome-associated translation inhibitor RaiA [Deltaproteobacteria bacterium]